MRPNGFTIVEMLIVIVVIAILAAITMVTYNGIQQRALITTTQSEMQSVAKSAEIFRVQYERGPMTASDFSTVLKGANLYTATRTTKKSYAICADISGYAFVAWNPLVEVYKNGDILYLYSSSGGQQIHELTNSSLSANDQLDKICDQVYGSSVFDAWTYDIP